MTYDKVAGIDETNAFPPEVRSKLAEAIELKAAYLPFWKPNTTYASGAYALSPTGQVIQANSAFTSGGTYSASNWTVVTGGTGSGAVTSVAGKTGVIVLVPADVSLGNVNNTSDAAKPISTAQAAVNAAKADLVAGLIPTSQIPTLALTTAIPVTNQTAMLALTSTQVQPGDVAIRSDGAGTFILLSADPSQLANWALLAAPTNVVTSVAGRNGVVTLGKSDVGLSNVDNTADVSKPISSAQAAVNAAKADLVGGVVPTSQLPSLSLETAVPVANRSAMLALTTTQVQPGDIAVDVSTGSTRGSYILTAADPSVIGNWILLNAPLDTVQSVNGQSGTVVLAASDLGLGNVNNISDVNKPISILQQAALDRKVTQLGVSSGTNDSTTINAALTANAGGVVRGMPGQTYYVDSPIIVPSSTELNMTGCIVQQTTGSAPRNMLQSAAFTSARTINDVAITASSTTLTSATGAFTSGDVGKNVRVYLGDIGRARFLNTTIASVTDSTHVVLAAAPDTTVAITGASIGIRDKNVRIIGGKWRRYNLTGGVPLSLDQHTFILRRTDGLTVSPEEMGQGTGKYMIHIADCNRFLVENVFFDQAPSDGVHLGGFSFDGTIRRLAGQVGDDLVAITAADYTSYNDCSGDVSDIQVDDVILHKSTGPTRFLISSDSSSQSYSYINVRRVNLSRIGTQELYQNGTSTPIGRLLMSGMLSGISVERTSIFMTYNRDGGTNGTMYLADLTIRDWTPRLDAATDALNVNDNAGTIIIDGVTDGGGAQTSRNIVVLGFTSKTVAVDRIIIRNARWDSTVGQARGVTMYPSVNVGYIEVDGGSFGGSSGAGNRVIDISGTCTCEAVTLRDVKTSAFGAWAVSHGGSGVTRLHVENSKLQSTSSFRTANTAGFDISGSNTVWGGVPNLAGTGVVRSVSTDVRLDVGLLPKVAGSIAFNTNSARSCGVGPVYCDGTNWIHLATSAVY